MRVISDVDLRVAMTSGAVIQLQAGVEREIADEVGVVAMQMGARMVDGDAPAPAPAPQKPDDHWSDEVSALTTDDDPDLNVVLDSVEELVTIIETIVSEGDPKNFKADNSPKAAIINKLAKRKVTTAEREAAWQIYLDR